MEGNPWGLGGKLPPTLYVKIYPAIYTENIIIFWNLFFLQGIESDIFRYSQSTISRLVSQLYDQSSDIKTPIPDAWFVGLIV